MKNRLVMLLCLWLCAYAQAYALPSVIDNSAYPASSGAANNVVTPATPSNTAMLELMAKMEQMQADIQQLTGKLEEQAYQIAELKKQQKSLSADFDERILNLENKAGGGAASAAAPAATPEVSPETAAATTVEANAVAPAENKRPIDAEPMAVVADAKPKATESASVEKAKPEMPNVPDDEKAAYQQAYELLRKGHTDQSIAELTAYLSNYPNSALANNAQYWLGEAYRVKKDNDSARKAFNTVIDNYPKSTKIPDALLKLGYIEIDQGHPDKAREYFTRVTNDYPDTPAAKFAAKKILTLNAN